ncbi:MAG: hypothetical protein Q8Q36_00440 [bacterium]|nr:hypothetical protein [bacterium]
MPFISKELLQSLKTLVIALILSIGVSQVFAWTGPTATAPGGNASAPVNVGATAQTKSGGLTVGSLGMTGTTAALSGGAESTYGAATIRGSKNGWSGLNFKDAAGTNEGTLMMHPFYSGFFNAADNNWRWYVDDSGNSYQYGLQYDAQNTGYYLDPNGTSRLNYTVNDNSYNYGWTQADVFYDRYNNGYYLQPRGTNRLNYVVADDVHVYGTIRGGSYGFGGMYADVDGYCTGLNGRVVNPFTGWCNCPAGFADANLTINSGGPFIHICYK